MISNPTSRASFLSFLKELFIFSVLGLSCCLGLSPVAGSGVALQPRCVGLSLPVAESGPWSPQASAGVAPGLERQAQRLWHAGRVAPQQVGPSRTRGHTCVPRTGRGRLTAEPPGTPKGILSGWRAVLLWGLNQRTKLLICSS